MEIFEQVSKDIVAAMKAKDKVRLEALRNIKKFFIEAKTAPGANDTLTDEAALKILAKLAKQGRDTAALYRERNRPDLAEEEEAQAAVAESYLPQPLSEAELEAALRDIIAETGAGQHGVATATVCALMNMECIVYMGKTDVERQHVNVEKMKMLGATVIPVTSGNMTLKDATNEAIRDWCCHPADTYYIIGSTVGPHPYPDMVARLQSVISEEIKKQLIEKEGRDCPDYLIACVGGGSNAAGTIYHYIDDSRVQIVLAEAGGKGIDTGMTAATIALGQMGIIHGARTYVIQNEDGQIEEPYSISAGLDYPGIGPMHANLAAQRRAIVLAVNDDEAIRAAYELTKLEGIIPALESAHALGALEKLNFKPDDVVVLTVSGRGDKDIETYLNN